MKIWWSRDEHEFWLTVSTSPPNYFAVHFSSYPKIDFLGKRPASDGSLGKSDICVPGIPSAALTPNNTRILCMCINWRQYKRRKRNQFANKTGILCTLIICFKALLFETEAPQFTFCNTCCNAWHKKRQSQITLTFRNTKQWISVQLRKISPIICKNSKFLSCVSTPKMKYSERKHFKRQSLLGKTSDKSLSSFNIRLGKISFEVKQKPTKNKWFPSHTNRLLSFDLD